MDVERIALVALRFTAVELDSATESYANQGCLELEDSGLSLEGTLEEQTLQSSVWTWYFGVTLKCIHIHAR